jgi:hypothetical protein
VLSEVGGCAVVCPLVSAAVSRGGEYPTDHDQVRKGLGPDLAAALQIPGRSRFLKRGWGLDCSVSPPNGPADCRPEQAESGSPTQPGTVITRRLTTSGKNAALPTVTPFAVSDSLAGRVLVDG